MQIAANRERKVERLSISVKAVGEDGQQGIIQGYLSTYDLDLGQDKVVKGAFAATIKEATSRRAKSGSPFLWPMLWQHNAEQHLPIGGITSAIEDNAGLLISAKLDLAQPLAMDCYNAVKFGSIGAMSIGYLAKEVSYEHDATGKTIRLLKVVDLKEGSLVLWPMQPNATISSVKRRGSMFGKDFATNYTEELAEDWMYSDWSSLCCALQDSIQETFTDGGDPLANLEQNVLPALASALRQYVQDGISLNAADYLQQQSGPGMDMMSASGAYDEKAGRVLSASTKAALAKIANGITSHVSDIQATVERERLNALAGYTVYSGSSARPELSRKAMMESSHTAIGAATSGIMTHVRSLKSMAYEARRQNDLRGWPIVRSRSSAEMSLEEKAELREITFALREMNKELESRDPMVQNLRDLREGLPSLTAGGPTTQQKLEGAQASIAVDIAMRDLMASLEKD